MGLRLNIVISHLPTCAFSTTSTPYITGVRYCSAMTSIIKIYRQILYYKVVPELSDLLLSLVMGIVFIVIGELLFTKLQKGFAEEF